jgi:hypothetical protein
MWTFEPQDTNVMLGNPISINCEANGYPRPTVTWFKGKNKASKEFQAIVLKNNTLTVNFATTDDEGFYMCQANNAIGNGLKKIIYVNVNEPARFDYVSKKISSRRNDPVILSCHAMGDEPLNIVWTHNNNRIDLNNYRISIAEMKTDEGVKSQLSISRSDRHDSGKYNCAAENQYGKSEHVIYLAVQGNDSVMARTKLFTFFLFRCFDREPRCADKSRSVGSEESHVETFVEAPVRRKFTRTLLPSSV